MSKCPKGKIPKSEWWINCAIQAMQDKETNNDNNNNNDDGAEKTNWSTLQCMTCNTDPETNLHTTEEQNKIKLVLDTGSTINATIKDKHIVHNICKSSNPIVMATNARKRSCPKRQNWLDSEQ